MKKQVLLGIIAVIFLLSGCNREAEAAKLVDWHFQYNEGMDNYSLFFGLLDDKDREIAQAVTVDIRIENKAAEIVYDQSKSLTKEDFDYYTNRRGDRKYLAEVTIPKGALKKGKESDGTVYLTVYKPDSFYFDEVRCDAFFCLPLKDISLECLNLPQVITLKDYYGKVKSKIEIEKVRYIFDKEYIPRLQIKVYGQKVFGKAEDSIYDLIHYKLSDLDGYVIENGRIFLNSLAKGDKFTEEITIYKIEAGGNYRLEFSPEH